MIERGKKTNTDFSEPKNRPWSDGAKNNLDNHQRGLDYLNDKLTALEKRVDELKDQTKTPNHLPEKKRVDFETK